MLRFNEVKSERNLPYIEVSKNCAFLPNFANQLSKSEKVKSFEDADKPLFMNKQEIRNLE